MSGVAAVFKRELASYFATPIAYVFIVIFLIVLAAGSRSSTAASTRRARRTLERVLLLAPVALSAARAGLEHAAVGRGAQVGQHRAADDAAARDVAGRRRQVPRRVGVHGASPSR